MTGVLNDILRHAGKVDDFHSIWTYRLSEAPGERAKYSGIIEATSLA